VLSSFFYRSRSMRLAVRGAALVLVAYPLVTLALRVGPEITRVSIGTIIELAGFVGVEAVLLVFVTRIFRIAF
jgi:hypothetical protein